MGVSILNTALLLPRLILILVSSSLFLVVSCHVSLNSDPYPLPSNFLFGTASSSYQYEGAYLADGKGLSNWDVYTHKPGNIMDGDNGDVAVDHYHHYLEDIDLMASLGVNSYRFSISWARILPKGKFGGVNLAGINYYSKLIDVLLLKGIEPFVTLTHFDNPQELEDRYGGWLSPKSREDYAYYANICFKNFGDRVKYWATFNEPNLQVGVGYRYGTYPPSRCSSSFGNCTLGDSEKEPFVAAHNMILAHASAVNIYRTKYQRNQKGKIGIVVHAIWFEPISNSTADKLASERAQAFFMNWFLDPVTFGKYPTEMRNIIGSNLPKFSSNDKKMLKKGLDFIGINHYTSTYVQDCMHSVCGNGEGTSKTEGFYQKTPEKDGVPLGESTAMEWICMYPQGMEKIVNYVKDRYNNIPMFITENGYAETNNPNASVADFLNDVKRVEYITGHLESLMTAMREGADVRGYFVWSLLDNFEWKFGYTIRFGLHYVDFATLKRTPKLSASWYSHFIREHKLKIQILMMQKKYNQIM